MNASSGPLSSLVCLGRHGEASLAHLPPEHLVESILEKERRSADVVGNIRRLLLQSK